VTTVNQHLATVAVVAVWQISRVSVNLRKAFSRVYPCRSRFIGGIGGMVKMRIILLDDDDGRVRLLLHGMKF
jgi:hypothetical protein